MRKRVMSRSLPKQQESPNNKEVDYTIEDAFGLFYQAKAIERLREKTLSDHRRLFSYFLRWVKENKPEVRFVNDLTKHIIRDYLAYLSFERPLYHGHPFKKTDKEVRGLSPGAVNVRFNALKAFCRWLYNEGLLDEDIMNGIRRQRVDEDRIVGFTDEQARLLLAQPDKNTYTGYRDYVLMLLLLHTGLRINEARHLEVGDVDILKRRITLSGSKNKNRRVRVIPFTKELQRHLLILINENGEAFPNQPLIFPTWTGDQWSVNTICHRIKEYGIRAGIADQVRCSPHTFRHTFAKNFLKSGGDVVALQRILGHSTMEMVRKYVQHNEDDISEAYEKYENNRKQRF